MHQIISPNYTQVPNVIFDYWMNVLSPAEFKVILYLCRKTFGWHKTKDKISRGKIAKDTGLTKEGVRKCLKSLEDYGLVIKTSNLTESGDNDCNTYEVRVFEPGGCYTDTPTPGIPITGVANSVGQGSQLSCLGGDQLSCPTKETKEKINKEKEKEIYKERKEDINIPLEPPPISAISKKTKIKEELVLREERVSTTSSQHESLLSKASGNELLLKAWYKKLSEWKIGKGLEGGKGDYLSITKWVIDAVSNQTNISPQEQIINTNKKLAREAHVAVGPRDPNFWMSRTHVGHRSQKDAIAFSMNPEEFKRILYKWFDLED